MRDNLGEDEKEKITKKKKKGMRDNLEKEEKEDNKRKKAKRDNLDDNKIKQLRIYEKKVKKVIRADLDYEKNNI